MKMEENSKTTMTLFYNIICFSFSLDFKATKTVRVVQRTKAGTETFVNEVQKDKPAWTRGARNLEISLTLRYLIAISLSLSLSQNENGVLRF